MAKMNVRSAELTRVITERQLTLTQAAKISGVSVATLSRCTLSDCSVFPATAEKLRSAFGDEVIKPYEPREMFYVARCTDFDRWLRQEDEFSRWLKKESYALIPPPRSACIWGALRPA